MPKQKTSRQIAGVLGDFYRSLGASRLESEMPMTIQEFHAFEEMKWVSVVGLQRIFSAERAVIKKLGELLENRPCLLKEPYTEMMDKPEVDVFEQYINDAEKWFEVFVGEFEGLKKIVGDNEK